MCACAQGLFFFRYYFLSVLLFPLVSLPSCLVGVWLWSCEFARPCGATRGMAVPSPPCSPRWRPNTQTSLLWSVRAQERWALHRRLHRLLSLLLFHLPTASLLSKRQVWTFRELQQWCNAVAHWALAQGWAESTVVALYMENCPLVVALWLGLAMVGVEAALINYNLRQQSFLHCIAESGAQAVVVGSEMMEGRKFMRLLWAVLQLLSMQ